MLLELLYHSINEELSHSIKDCQIKYIQCKAFILKQKFDDIRQSISDQSKYQTNYRCVFVDIVVHFNHSGLVLRFNLGLKIRQEAISNPRNDQIQSSKR